MKSKPLLAIIIFILLIGSFGAGFWVSRRQGLQANPSNAETPTVYSPAKPDTVADNDMDASSLPPGTVRISPDKQQMIGVRTGVVEKAAVNHALRTVGRVAPDEKRVYRLVAGTDGWIRETYSNDTGTFVKKDERLASFYSPLFRTTQINYLSMLGSSPDERYDAGRRQALAPSQLATVNIKTYTDALESLGMSEQQMKELARTRQVTDDVFIVAPATGFIIARNVSPGQQFQKGFEWYRLADLERVWIFADLYPKEAGYTRPGMKARVTLPDQNKQFQATVEEVLPLFDLSSQTLKVRLELDNPDYVLRPDMFVDVEIPVTLTPAITVPADAILDSGLRKTVFVERGNGLFEPREVETGRQLGNLVEIKKGLEEGERIVISGNFLLDSESKLELASWGMQTGLSKDPVNNLDVSERKATREGRTAVYKGKTYYFSSDGSKAEFEKEPERWVKE